MTKLILKQVSPLENSEKNREKENTFKELFEKLRKCVPLVISQTLPAHRKALESFVMLAERKDIENLRKHLNTLVKFNKYFLLSTKNLNDNEYFSKNVCRIDGILSRKLNTSLVIYPHSIYFNAVMQRLHTLHGKGVIPETLYKKLLNFIEEYLANNGSNLTYKHLQNVTDNLMFLTIVLSRSQYPEKLTDFINASIHHNELIMIFLTKDYNPKAIQRNSGVGHRTRDGRI